MKILFYAILLTIFNYSLGAAEISGVVQEVSANSATVRVQGDQVPALGDKAEIFFKLGGSDDEISVAAGKVSKITGNSIQIGVENATGEVAKDQLVRIKSDRPETKPVARPAAAASGPPPDLPPAATTAYRSEVQQIATHVFTFDELPAGPLPGDAFASEGLWFQKQKGEAAIHATQANMLLPRPHGKVLLVGGGPLNALTILLDPPVKHFALYRIGAANGASTPTWKMTAYNSGGKAVGNASEEHKITPPAASFSIEAADIVRVEIATDNRHGKGTWATWNSVPIVGVGFDR